MFPDPSLHPEWLRPQSKEWCAQLAAETGEYKYPWKSHFVGTSAEEIFTNQLSSIVNGRVLDVGCGHGEFTCKWASKAKEIVGIDITEGFIATANKIKPESVHFMVVDTKNDKLPFSDNHFDVAFTKKGPTSWYREGNRIVKPGGVIIGLHPDEVGLELADLFPGFFTKSIPVTPFIDVLNSRLTNSGLKDIDIQKVEEIEYLATPEDVLLKKCFGQNKKVKEFARQNCLRGIEEIFYKHATSQGIKTTNIYYIITAKAS